MPQEGARHSARAVAHLYSLVSGVKSVMTAVNHWPSLGHQRLTLLPILAGSVEGSGCDDRRGSGRRLSRETH